MTEFNPTQHFPSVLNIKNYIQKTYTEYGSLSWLPLPFELIQHWLQGDITSSTWSRKYVNAQPDSFTLPGQTLSHRYINFLYKNQTETSYFSTFIIHEHIARGVRELAVAFPEEINYMFPVEIRNSVDLNTFTIKDVLIAIKQKLTTIHWPETWISQTFGVSVSEDYYEKFLTHEIVLFCCDNFFCVPNNTYWIMTLPIDSPHVLSKRNISYKVKTETAIVSGKLRTSVIMGSNKIGVVHGYPFLLYFHDKTYSQEQFKWGQTRLPLDYIFADLEDRVRELDRINSIDFDQVFQTLENLKEENKQKVDMKYLQDNLSAIVSRIGNLEDGVHGQDLQNYIGGLIDRINKVETSMSSMQGNRDITALSRRLDSIEVRASNINQLNAKAEEMLDKYEDFEEALDCVKTIRVVVSAEDIKIAIESGGSSFWGNLLGGIAGGALGGLGSALGSVISTKGQIASMLGQNAMSTVNSTLKDVGINSLKDMGKNVSNMGKKFDAYNAFQRTTESAQQLLQRKINAIQQNVHGKFDTIDNIVSTIDTISKWVDPETGESVDMTDKLKDIVKTQNNLATQLSALDVVKRRQESVIQDIADLLKDNVTLKNSLHILRVDVSFLHASLRARGFVEESMPVKAPPPSPVLSQPVSRSRVDEVVDNITELNVALDVLHNRMEKVEKSGRGGLRVSYTTGNQPFNPHTNVRSFQDER